MGTSLSIVAAIIDKHGNMNRMVITHPNNLRYHINKGERSVTLPKRVQEPVSDHEAYCLVQRLEELVKARRARLVL